MRHPISAMPTRNTIWRGSISMASGHRVTTKYGARWLGLAAQKGQHQAQALLGQMLFNGDQLPRQAARGLMWLTLARDSAGPDETWIKESYNRAHRPRPPMTTAPWRCRCWSTGFRAAAIEGSGAARPRDRSRAGR